MATTTTTTTATTTSAPVPTVRTSHLFSSLLQFSDFRVAGLPTKSLDTLINLVRLVISKLDKLQSDVDLIKAATPSFASGTPEVNKSWKRELGRYCRDVFATIIMASDEQVVDVLREFYEAPLASFFYLSSLEFFFFFPSSLDFAVARGNFSLVSRGWIRRLIIREEICRQAIYNLAVGAGLLCTRTGATR
eukprot:gnl/Spiro4/20880_TR10171_c1_g1_i1.p1 gnl/Spiro4/20880_TR10171_c1_g1~~gnl/Spiro4/20880_TR10171_c1_g1_i1.p1  ORF type:complete len:191 (+),score=29.51 gnl/Spiro4/20880_TR10171_c1_g1_i1:189-761(+)